MNSLKLREDEMSTASYTVTDAAYTEVSATNNILQNKSSQYVRVVFSTVLPAVDDPNYFDIAPGQGFVTKDGVPSNNTYARATEGEAVVVVGEG